MNNIKGKLIFFLFLFANFLFAQNVIIIVIDGARYSETFGGGNTYIPRMYDDLRPSGYLYTNFRIAHEGKTETNPGHATILSGTWQQIANDGSQHPTKPTLFEYFRKQLGTSLTENYILGGKAKLSILSYSTDADYGADYRSSSICSDIPDSTVFNNCISVMGTYHPRLILINLADTDHQGHSGVWSNYINALANADNIVYQLWQHIQAGDYGYTSGNTTLFVTNDHGRHDDAHGGFTNHGDDCEGCEHIMLFAIGRNVSPGTENSDLHYQTDIAPTVGNLLNFLTPQASGTSLYEGDHPLPVELFSFTADIIENSVKLSWSTKRESNNLGFEIERQIPNDNWKKIGFVEGIGNSYSLQFYKFFDKDAPKGIINYRLKQLSSDGRFEYSSIIEINLDSPDKFEIEQNYPNPFNPVTIIRYYISQSSNVVIRVIDVLGNEIITLVNEEKPVGRYKVEFNATTLSSGVYFYQIIAGSFIETKKMVLMK